MLFRIQFSSSMPAQVGHFKNTFKHIHTKLFLFQAKELVDRFKELKEVDIYNNWVYFAMSYGMCYLNLGNDYYNYWHGGSVS